MSRGASIEAWIEGHRVDVSEVTDDAVVGIAHVKRELASLVGRLAAPELLAQVGGSLPRGVVLWGRPGCGKTLSARLLAANVARLSRPIRFYEVSADELSPSRIRDIFRHLGQTTAEAPAILYLDEIDLIARHRGSRLQDPKSRRALTALLAGMDGISAAGEVVVVASTNASPSELDDALIRPGRFGHLVHVTDPAEDEREALFHHFLARVTVTGVIDHLDLARRTRVATPADIRGLVEDAVALAIAAGRTEVTAADVEEALARSGRIEPEVVQPSVDWRVALHAAGAAAVAEAIRPGSVERIQAWHGNGGIRTNFDGFGPADGQQLMDLAATSFGGMLAQRRLGVAGFGAVMDIEEATVAMLTRIETGVDPSVPTVSASTLGPLLSEELRTAFSRAVTTGVQQARDRADAIVAANLGGIERLARRVMEASELEGEDLGVALADAAFRQPGASAGHQHGAGGSGEAREEDARVH